MNSDSNIPENWIIPEGWELVNLGDIVQFFKGQGLSKSLIQSDGKFSCILYGELFTTYKRVIKSIKSKTDADVGIPSKSNDIIIPASTTTVALDLAIASALKIENVRLGGDINILRDKGFKNYSNEYLAYFLTEIQKSEIARLAQGSTIIHLYGNNMRKIKVLLPPLAEQIKIAGIFQILNEVIATIEEQIEEWLKLKKSIMQTLLTKGAGHTEFKGSIVGDIPKGWDVVPLETIAKRGSGHTPNKNFPGYYNGSIKWVSLADSNKLDNRWINNSKFKISNEGVKKSSAVIHTEGTVLMSRDAGVGKSAIMGDDMAVSQHFITWTCGEQLNNWFLYYHLQYNKPLFERIAVGSTIKTIGLPFFKKHQIPLPPLAEQVKISEILYLSDDKIDSLIKRKETYSELRNGLMQQLLTGKTRVSTYQQQSAVA